MRAAYVAGRRCRNDSKSKVSEPVRGRLETGMKTNTRNERWPRLHDRLQRASEIDASRLATFLDHVPEPDSEFRKEVEAWPESDKPPAWEKRAVDRATTAKISSRSNVRNQVK